MMRIKTREKVTALLMAALVSLGAATESFGIYAMEQYQWQVDFRGWRNRNRGRSGKRDHRIQISESER